MVVLHVGEWAFLMSELPLYPHVASETLVIPRQRLCLGDTRRAKETFTITLKTPNPRPPKLRHTPPRVKSQNIIRPPETTPCRHSKPVARHQKPLAEGLGETEAPDYEDLGQLGQDEPASG